MPPKSTLTIEPVAPPTLKAVAPRITLNVEPVKQRVLDHTQAAQYLSVSPRTLQKLVAAKKLRQLKQTAKRQYDVKALDAYLDMLQA